jgi:hypothetical protein
MRCKLVERHTDFLTFDESNARLRTTAYSPRTVVQHQVICSLCQRNHTLAHSPRTRVAAKHTRHRRREQRPR